MSADENSNPVDAIANFVDKKTKKPLTEMGQELLRQIICEDRSIKQLRYQDLKPSYIQRIAIYQKLFEPLSQATGKQVRMKNVKWIVNKILEEERSHSEDRPHLPSPVEIHPEHNGHAAFNGSLSCPELGNGKIPAEQPNSHCSNSKNSNNPSSSEEYGTPLFSNGHLHESSEADNSESLGVENYSPNYRAEELALPSHTSQPDNDEPNPGNSLFGWHNFINFIKPGVPLLLSLGILGSGFALSWVANWYGAKNYLVGNLSQAQFGYNLAQKFNPVSTAVHYNQGAIYEDLGKHDYKKAHDEYRQACLGGSIAACNNKARLYNLEKDYDSAVLLLNKYLHQAKDNDDKHTILKNLGWARMGQGRFDEAKSDLEKAIQLNKQEAVPHCLLAQVLESKNDKKSALVQWELCDNYAYLPKHPEEDKLYHLAKQRLDAEGSQK